MLRKIHQSETKEMDSERSGERKETLHSDVYDQFIIWPIKHSAVIILQSPVWFRPRFFLLVCLFVCLSGLNKKKYWVLLQQQKSRLRDESPG